MVMVMAIWTDSDDGGDDDDTGKITSGYGWWCVKASMMVMRMVMACTKRANMVMMEEKGAESPLVIMTVMAMMMAEQVS